MDYLSEAFKQLEILNEDVFDLDKDGLEDLKDFQDETEEEVIDVIDPDAENEEELEDSYIGKVILDCSVCHTDIYKDKEDVIIDEETQLANVGEECPYCFSVDGFKVIGEVKPFVETEFETEDDVDVEVDGKEVEKDEDFEESLNEDTEKQGKCCVNKGKEGTHGKFRTKKSADAQRKAMFANGYKTESLNEDWLMEPGKTYVSRKGNKLTVKSVKPYISEFDGDSTIEVEYDYELIDGKTGSGRAYENGIFNMLTDRFSKDESFSRRNRKSLTEAPVYGLEPRYDSRKSFYGKAQVDTGDKGDKNKLYSYGTLVAEMKDGKPVVYGTYSATTLRYIKDWLKQNGFRADTSKQIVADYGVKDEACTGKDCAIKPRKIKESKVPMKMSRKSLKEGWNTKDVERFLKDAVKDIMDEKGTCATMKLDNRLAVCVGWSDGYYDDDVSVIHAKNEPEWGMNAGIKVWTSDSMRTDFDFINAPYNEDTGDVWDTSVSISPDEDYASLASYFEKEYDKMKEYEIDEDGKIVGKWSDEDEEFEESLKNRKSRKLKESIGSDLKKFLDFYEDRLNQQENADVIEKIDAILDDNDLSGDTDIDKLFYAMNFSDREKIMSLIDGAKKVSPWRDLRKMKESIEDIKIDTGDQEITVSARDKEKVESDGEMIAPLSDETKTDIEMNTEEENGDEVDVDMDEFSEKEFDDLGESYLKKVYENVDSYKTTSVSEKGNKLKVEGLIKFTSGKTKKTSFVFEAKTIDKNGHAKFLGENLQISRGHKSFKLSGTVSNNKFIAESLNYNYRAKNGKNSQRVYGTVKVNKK